MRKGFPDNETAGSGSSAGASRRTEVLGHAVGTVKILWLTEDSFHDSDSSKQLLSSKIHTGENTTCMYTASCPCSLRWTEVKMTLPLS